jgi:hypothetical protein
LEKKKKIKSSELKEIETLERSIKKIKTLIAKLKIVANLGGEQYFSLLFILSLFFYFIPHTFSLFSQSPSSLYTPITPQLPLLLDGKNRRRKRKGEEKGQSFPPNWVGGISSNLIYKSDMCHFF